MNFLKKAFYIYLLFRLIHPSLILTMPDLIEEIPTLKQNISEQQIDRNMLINYKKLVKGGLAIHDGFECAKLTNKNNIDIETKLVGADLFIALVKKDKYLKKAIGRIIDTIKSENDEALERIIVVLKHLLTEEDKKVDPKQISKNATDLFEKILVAKDFPVIFYINKTDATLESFLDIAKFSIDSDNKKLQKKIADYILVLNEQQNMKFKKKAIEYSKIIAKNLVDTSPKRSYILYASLVKENEAIDDAIKAVKNTNKLMKKNIITENLKNIISGLIKDLIKKNHISQQDKLDLTIIAIELGIQLSEMNNLSSLLDEFSNKLDRNEDFENATKLAIATMKINDPDLIKKAINILTKLIEKDQTTEEMIGAIEYGLENENDKIKMDAEILIEKLLEKIGNEYSITFMLLLKLCISKWNKLINYQLKENIKNSIQIALAFIQTLDEETLKSESEGIGQFLVEMKKNSVNFQELMPIVNEIIREKPSIKIEMIGPLIQETSDRAATFEKKIDDWTKKTRNYFNQETDNVNNWELINNFEKNLKETIEEIEYFNSQIMEYKIEISQAPEDKQYKLKDPLNKLEIKIQKIRIKTFDKFTKIFKLTTISDKYIYITEEDANEISEERENNAPPKKFINMMIKFMLDKFAGTNPIENIVQYHWQISGEPLKEGNIIVGNAINENLSEAIDFEGITRIFFSKLSKYLQQDDIYKIWARKSEDSFIPTKNKEEENEKTLKAIALFILYSLKNIGSTSISLKMPIFVYDYLLYGKIKTENLNGQELDNKLIKWLNYMKSHNKENYMQIAISSFFKILNPKISDSEKTAIINTVNGWNDLYLTEESISEESTNLEIKKTIIKIMVEILISDEMKQALDILRKTFWQLNRENIQTKEEQLNNIRQQLQMATGWNSKDKLRNALRVNKKFMVLLFQTFIRFLQPEDLQEIFNPIVKLEDIKITYKNYSPTEYDFELIKNNLTKFLDENKDDHKKLKLFVEFIAGGLYPNNLEVDIYTKENAYRPFSAHTCSKILEINIYRDKQDDDKDIRIYNTFKNALENSLETIK